MKFLLCALLLVFSLALAFGNDCECVNKDCGCCVQIKIKDPKVDAPACVNLTYDPQTLSASIVVTIDNIVVYNKTESLHDPNVCFGVPFIPLVDICLDFSNLSFDNKHLSGCLTIKAEAFGFTVGKFDAGCFNINVLENPSARVSRQARLASGPGMRRKMAAFP